LTSQLPVAKWRSQIGDPTIADSILDRLVHAAHRIELEGTPMRKKKPGQGDKTSHPKPDADGTPKSQ
jgi:DNA replication protein DnaC